LTLLRSHAPGLALVALVATSAVVRVWANKGFEGPQLLCDEYVYAGVARRFATTGHLDLAGGPSAGGSLLYPALIAPAWLAHKMSTVYDLAKAINAVLVSLTAVPTYLWARRVVSPWWALLAAGLVLLETGAVLSGMLMGESASIPAVMFGVFAIGIAVERATPWTQALAVIALAVAYEARAQGLVLLAILPTAFLLAFVFDLRAGVPRSEALGKLRRYWPLATLLACAIVAYLANSGFSPSRSIGFYQPVATAHYHPLAVVLWTARHAGEAVLAVAVAPACAFLLLLTSALTRGLPRPADRALVATAAASVFWFLLQTGAFAAEFSPGILERYSLYAFPPLIVTFVLWLARGLPRPRLETLIATVAALALVPLILFGSLLRPGKSLEPVAFSLTLHLFRRVPEHVPGGLPSARILLFAVAVAVALIFAVAPTRFLRLALPAGVAVMLLLASNSVQANLTANSQSWPNSTGPVRSWIDAQIGTSAGTAAYLYVPDPTARASSTVLANTVFWNRSIGDLYSFGARQVCPFFRIRVLRVDNRTGELIDARGRRFRDTRVLVTDRHLAIAGRREAVGGSSVQRLAVYRPSSPLRLASQAVGVYSDGWTRSNASFFRYSLPKPKPKWLDITLSRAGWRGPDKPGLVTLTLRRLTGRPSTLARRRWVAHTGRSKSFQLLTPQPPFEVSVHVAPTFSPTEFGIGDPRQLGVQVSLRARGGAPGACARSARCRASATRSDG
jgi:hypothetical protein